MSPTIATVVCVIGMLGLFILDSRSKSQNSWAIWIPILWLLIAGSRHVSAWLGASPEMTQEQYLEGSPLDAQVYAVLIAAAIVVLLGRSKKVLQALSKNRLLIVFVVYCAFSILWSDYPLVALKRWIKSLGDYSVMLIILTEPDALGALKQVLGRVALVLMPLSVLFIKYYPALGRTYASHWDSTQFLVGVSDNKNMLGMVCMVFGFAAAWRVIEELRGPRHHRLTVLLVHGSIVVMSVCLLIWCDSKTSLVCFAVTTAVVAAHAFLPFARNRIVVHLMVVTIILICFSVLFLGIGSDMLGHIGRDSTLTGRTDIWKVLRTVQLNPLIGTGFESFWLGKRLSYLWSFQILEGITEAHNGYFEVYLNLGYIGVAVLMALMCSGYREIVHQLVRDSDRARLRLGFLIIAVIYNFTEAGIRTSDLVWIGLLIAIMTVPNTALREVASRTRLRPVSVEQLA